MTMNKLTEELRKRVPIIFDTQDGLPLLLMGGVWIIIPLIRYSILGEVWIWQDWLGVGVGCTILWFLLFGWKWEKNNRSDVMFKAMRNFMNFRETLKKELEKENDK